MTRKVELGVICKTVEVSIEYTEKIFAWGRRQVMNKSGREWSGFGFEGFKLCELGVA